MERTTVTTTERADGSTSDINASDANAATLPPPPGRPGRATTAARGSTATSASTTGPTSSASSGLGQPVGQLKSDLTQGVHKVAQQVGLEEKPTSTKLKEDVRNIGDDLKKGARSVGH
jgi:hypothetical protein